MAIVAVIVFNHNTPKNQLKFEISKEELVHQGPHSLDRHLNILLVVIDCFQSQSLEHPKEYTEVSKIQQKSL